MLHFTHKLVQELAQTTLTKFRLLPSTMLWAGTFDLTQDLFTHALTTPPYTTLFYEEIDFLLYFLTTLWPYSENTELVELRTGSSLHTWLGYFVA